MNNYIILSKNKVYCDTLNQIEFNHFRYYLKKKEIKPQRKSVKLVSDGKNNLLVEQFWLNATKIKQIIEAIRK